SEMRVRRSRISLRFIRATSPRATSATGEQNGPARTCRPEEALGDRTARYVRTNSKRYATYELIGPDLHQTPGGWGAEEPALGSKPGPEATAFRFTFQLDPRLTEVGQ